MNEQHLIKQIRDVSDLTQLENLRVKLLGRKGLITEELKLVGRLPIDERSSAGAKANALRRTLVEELANRESALHEEMTREVLKSPLDLSEPGEKAEIGHNHPVMVVLNELIDIYWQMGYQVVEGPEVETEWYNFEALNIPYNHPARDMQDTFYLNGGLLPRTHTSGIQIRHMEKYKDQLPIRIIAPGKVYRNEDEDARHSWSFYQLEGLVVDKNISLADLKGTLEAMMKGILGEGTQIRLRSNYFPYTEPSVEMDATCSACMGLGEIKNKACHLCGGSGWLELGGAGMVHPQVFKNVGIDPNVYSGFAFGFGPERIAAIKYGVDDVREFWRPDFRFLKQF